MALQGTLDTFALPDVLHLLAATKKTGCLRLTGDRGAGAVWVDGGQTVAVSADHAPLAVEPVDALFELLRFEEGSFAFAADEHHDQPGSATDVETLLSGAGDLLAEWREIESVVPSLDAYVTLRRHLDTDDVTISADKWPALVAVGDGATVRGIGERLQLAELPVSRAVRDLVELGIVDLEERAPAPTVAPSPAPAPALAPAPVTEAAPGATAAILAPAVDEAPSLPPLTGMADDDVPTEAALEERTDQDDPAAAVTGDADDLPVARPIRARRPRPRTVESSSTGTERFVPLDLPGNLSPAAVHAATAQLDGPLDDLAAAFPGLAGRAGTDEAEDEEVLRQLAALPPEAAEAVQAAADAPTEEAREAALAEAAEVAEAADAPINRGLLLKFLGSVKS